MKLLLAEDDPHVGAGIVQGLKLAGFAVDWVHDGHQAKAALTTNDYALLILDLGMPGPDGLSLLDMLRHNGNALPVLVVTARDTLADRVGGLNRGADDYLIKPFDLEELIARVNALLRRGQVAKQTQLRLGKLSVTPLTRAVNLDGQEIQLTAREFALLVTLMENPGAVVTLRDIDGRLYGNDDEVSNNAVEVLLHRLRRKLGSKWIRNVRGVGYKLVEPA